jgi:hypothetical protein
MMRPSLWDMRLSPYGRVCVERNQSQSLVFLSLHVQFRTYHPPYPIPFSPSFSPLYEACADTLLSL